ncbi:hypothetical protein B0H14DRAFT_2570980 [Mycena olivaceomarginata]|nr:hypothetical protein B0H14DRAFT_2570980 [Mycena olivaceomarginata]
MFNCTVLVLEVQKTKEQGIKQGRGFDYQVLNGTTTLGSNWRTEKMDAEERRRENVKRAWVPSRANQSEESTRIGLGPTKRKERQEEESKRMVEINEMDGEKKRGGRGNIGIFEKTLRFDSQATLSALNKLAGGRRKMKRNTPLRLKRIQKGAREAKAERVWLSLSRQKRSTWWRDLSTPVQGKVFSIILYWGRGLRGLEARRGEYAQGRIQARQKEGLGSEDDARDGVGRARRIRRGSAKGRSGTGRDARADTGPGARRGRSGEVDAGRGWAARRAQAKGRGHSVVAGGMDGWQRYSCGAGRECRRGAVAESPVATQSRVNASEKVASRAEGQMQWANQAGTGGGVLERLCSMWAGTGKGGAGVWCPRRAARGTGLRKQVHGVRDFEIEKVAVAAAEKGRCGRLEEPEANGQDRGVPCSKCAKQTSKPPAPEIGRWSMSDIFENAREPYGPSGRLVVSNWGATFFPGIFRSETRVLGGHMKNDKRMAREWPETYHT